MSKCVTVLLAVVIRHLHFKKKIGCNHIFKNLNRYVENTSTCLEHEKNDKMCHCAIGGGHSVIFFNISKKNIGKVPARQLSSDISNKRQPQNCSRLSFFQKLVCQNTYFYVLDTRNVWLQLQNFQIMKFFTMYFTICLLQPDHQKDTRFR